MGTYSTEEWRELFGGDPEPGEAYLPLDAIDHLRKAERENAHTLGDRPSTGLSSTELGLLPGRRESGGCDACGAPRDEPCAHWCDLHGKRA